MTDGLVVQCGDYFHFQDPEEERTVSGFTSRQQAAEYARRVVRSEVEHYRAGATDLGAVSAQYYGFGDYAWHPDVYHRAWVEFCIAHPATTPEETDWLAVAPARKAVAR